MRDWQDSIQRQRAKDAEKAHAEQQRKAEEFIANLPKPSKLPAGVEEIRVVDPTTGGEKGSKLARYDLIPGDVLHALAEHYGRGSLKYADRNWQKGYKWSLSFAALNRHLWAWWEGEDIDAETGSNHMVAVIWHAVALLWYARHRKELDDRPNTVHEKAA